MATRGKSTKKATAKPKAELQPQQVEVRKDAAKVFSMQGAALMQSGKVDLFNPKNLAICSTILILCIGGNLMLANGIYPFNIPLLIPDGIPAIVFSAIAGILMYVIFVIFKKDWDPRFGCTMGIGCGYCTRSPISMYASFLASNLLLVHTHDHTSRPH